MKEIWKTIDGFNGDYEVSNLGNVRSYKHRKPKLMALCDYRGYKRIELFKDGFGRLYSVHRLVANAFIKNNKNKETVNHLNGIKSDNRVENLEWATRSENDLHAFSIGLRKPHPSMKGRYGKDNPKSKPVEQLTKDGILIKRFSGVSDAIRMTGIGNISNACIGRRNSAGGYLWRHCE